MFGPRVSFPAGKFRPFAEFEVGVGHVTANGSAVANNTIIGFASDTSYATALGGGLDYKDLQPACVAFGRRLRAHPLFGAGQNSMRLSTGIAFRF